MRRPLRSAPPRAQRRCLPSRAASWREREETWLLATNEREREELEWRTKIVCFLMTQLIFFSFREIPLLAEKSGELATSQNASLTQGYVARWTSINPGADGSFTVRATHHSTAESGYKAYAFDVFMLEEAAAAPSPTITITGTPLSAFSTDPGTPLAEQSYTISGSNLTNDIAITAPADFQIATTSGGVFVFP